MPKKNKVAKEPFVTCNECGWVHFAISREHALEEVASFNKYYSTLTKKEQKEFYGGKSSSIGYYEHCRCGNTYKDFRKAKAGDVPHACTVSPIIQKKD